jgi:hypothetical protein
VRHRFGVSSFVFLTKYFPRLQLLSGRRLSKKRIPQQALKRDRRTRRPSQRPHKPKPLRAPMCKNYSECLTVAALEDCKTLPCANCNARHDIMPWELQNNDILGHRLLLVAIFYPDQWRGSLFYTIRNMSFQVRSEYKTHAHRGVEPCNMTP